MNEIGRFGLLEKYYYCILLVASSINARDELYYLRSMVKLPKQVVSKFMCHTTKSLKWHWKCMPTVLKINPS